MGHFTLFFAILAIAYRWYRSIPAIDIDIWLRSTRMRWKSDFRIHVGGAHIGPIHDDSVSSLAELNNEIQWRTKEKYKISLLCIAISEIHAVLAVLCEIDRAIALHECMPRSAGCGRTGSERANRNIPNVDIDSWYRRYRLYAICRIQGRSSVMLVRNLAAQASLFQQ